jgi:putative nucleotidyltransferase with HDIG domain
VNGAIGNALLEMQGALVARSLYNPDDARIRACEERAAELLRGCLEEIPEITLFSPENRVIFRGEILPASASLADTLFPMLRRRGVDQLTFRRGLDREELSEFLDDLALEEHDGRPLRCGPHIGLGLLQQACWDAERKERCASTDRCASFAQQAADALPNLWMGAGCGGEFDTELLGDIVSGIRKAVHDTRSAMIPLAPLKRHDEYTFVHTINVAILSTSVGEALGFDPHTIHELTVAALLHDVGKQVIPQEILDKQGQFTEEEFRVMRMHTVEGARILLNTPGVPELAPIVAYEHHVRGDGTGYPKMPPDWKLNLASRIVQMADVFDALRTTRPYRAGLPVPKVVEVMRRDIGNSIDADLLRIFFEYVVARGAPELAGSSAG